MSESFESWVEDFADLEGAESDEADFEAEAEAEDVDDVEDQDDVEDLGDAEARSRRRPRHRARPRRRIRAAQPRSYGRGVKGVGGGLVRTPAGDARIALQQRVPSLREFQQTVGQISGDARKTADAIKQLETQQRQDAAFFGERVAELKRDIARTRKQAALIGVASALAPVVVRLVQQQTADEPANALTTTRR
jgi:hypothetical protein